MWNEIKPRYFAERLLQKVPFDEFLPWILFVRFSILHNLHAHMTYVVIVYESKGDMN